MKPNPKKESITECAPCFAGCPPALSRSSITLAAILLFAAASPALGQPAFGDAGFGAGGGGHETILVSRASGADGDSGNDSSSQLSTPSVSADGRYAAFMSAATNLHPDDTDGTSDIFVRDLETDETILVSRASGTDGVKGDGHSQQPSISADGRYVAFHSRATNLHPDDTDGAIDIFVRDLLTHETILVSRASGPDGVKSDGFSTFPWVSADGRYVAFISSATNLHPDDTDSTNDVFVRDLQTHDMILASRATGADGEKSNDFSVRPVISADGRHVAFMSSATNLHPDDTDSTYDIFVRDLQTDETILASRAIGADGEKGDASSDYPSLSSDGRYVAFHSFATNLYPDDTNGTSDIFVRDLQTHETILASRAAGADGEESNGFSARARISGDGRFVTFDSKADNLHPDDSDAAEDIYARDLLTHRTFLVSRAGGADGDKGNAPSNSPSISAGGRFVFFVSLATNLDPDDTDDKWDVYMRDVLGPAAVAELSFDPLSLDFGDVEVGASSASLMTTLRNISDTDVTGLAFDSPGNGFDTDTSDCGATLPVDGTCVIVVTFTPPDFGAFTGTLTAISDQDPSAATLDLAGTGVGSPEAVLGFDPESLAFGDVEVGDSSPSLTATLQNTGAGAASDLNFFVASNFTADASACGTSLGAGENCAVVINFTPLAPGAVGREVQVTSTEGASAELALTGNGVAPPASRLSFIPDGFDFGELAVGASSAPQTVMLHNTGNADATGLTFSAPLGGFEADAGDCGDTLPAGASCPVHVTFTPELPGVVGATLMVKSAEGAVASLEGNTPDKHLYFLTQGFNSIFRMDPADIGSGRPLFTSDTEQTHAYALYGLEVDTTHCAYYWVPEHRVILRARIDGTAESVLFDTFGGGGLRDLAIDDAAGHLYFTRSQSIYRGDIGPDGLSNIVLLATTPEGRQAVAGGSNTIESMALDLVAGHVYWTGATGVWRADLDGSNVELVTDASSDAKPEGIGLDLQAGKVYWGDSEQNPDGDVRIHRANLDGTGYEVLIVQSSGSQIHGVRDIAVDPDLGKIFWSMSNNEGLFRANLDGTEIEEIPQIDQSVASALTFARGDIDALCGPPAADICPAGSQCDAVDAVYWVGGTSQHGELWRANADGSYRESIHTFTEFGSPRGVTVTRELGKVYWTQSHGEVYRANLDGSGVELMLQLPFAGSGDFTTNMALDLSAGKMFIGQQRRNEFVGPDSSKATLWRANLDGSGLEVRMVLDDLEFATMGGPQLDEQTRAGYVIADDTIYRFALDDDTAPEVIVPSLPLDLYPEGEGWELEFSGLELQIDLLKGKLYWSQAFHNDITGVRARRSYRVNLDGTQLEALSWEPASSEWQGRRGLAMDPRGGRMYGAGIFGDGVSRWEIEDGADLGLIHSSLPASPIHDIDLLPAASGSNRAVLSMRGVGVGAGLAIDPALLDFGAVPAGDKIGPEIVTLTSTGNAPVEVTGISAAATPFERTGGDCPATPFELAPEASCTLDYRFAPTELGAFEQTLTVESTVDPLTFDLAGVGVPPPPRIDVDPEALELTVVTGGTGGETLTLGNLGAEPLTWTIHTAEPAALNVSTRAHFPAIPRRVEHKHDPDASVGFDPQRSAFQAGTASAPDASSFGVGVPAYSTTYAPSVGYATFDAIDPSHLTTIVDPQPANFFAATFIDNAFDKQYFLTSVDDSLPDNTWATINTTTGELTALGTISGSPAGNWTSMKWDATTDTVYALKHGGGGSQLFVIDPTTLEATLVGSIDGSGVNPGAAVIAIAVSPEGLMYGIDIIDDVLLAIDKETGEAAVIGSLGLNVNFAQDMDFDQSTGFLYWAGYYDSGGYNSQIFTVDTGTGVPTAIGNVDGGHELASFSIAVARSSCYDPASIPWLSAAPASGETPGGGTDDVQVSVDTTALELGTYEALLCVASNDPAKPLVAVPVTLNVDEAPPAPGELDLAPTELDFGALPAGNAATLSFTVSNAAAPGAEALELTAIDPAGDAAFSIAGGDCAVGGMLDPGESCTVEVSFSPGGEGAFSGAVTVETEDGQSAAVDLSGTGTALQPGELAVNPPELDFGALPAGNAAMLSFTVSNAAAPGAQALELTAIDPAGDAAFSIAGGDCTVGGMLDPGESCTVEVSFSPQGAGEFTGEVSVATSDGQSDIVHLAGTAELLPDELFRDRFEESVD